MGMFHIETGYTPAEGKGYVSIRPPLPAEITARIMTQVGTPPDNERDYQFSWGHQGTHEAQQISVKPVILEEMYLFRNYIASLLHEHDVTVAGDIQEVEGGQGLIEK